MANTGGGGPRPRGAWWREGAITAVAFLLCLLGGVVQVDDTLAPPPAAAYLIAAVSCAVLPVRHRAPLAAMAVTTAAGVLVPAFDLLLSPLSVAPAVITAYSLTARTERHAAGAVSITSLALLVASAPFFGALSWQDASRVAAVAAFPLVAGVLGYSVQNRRAYLAAVEERAQRAEESRESEASQRVAEERVRIARELHDLVAHQITLANAQATVAAHLFDTRPEQTRKSLHELVETTSNALDELRATVGLLRQSGDAPVPSEPAPGLARLPKLLESFSRAGLEVEVRQNGTVRPLPPGVDLTAYRILQEALTNVTKHANTQSAQVRLFWSAERLTVSIFDGGGDPHLPSRASTTTEQETWSTKPRSHVDRNALVEPRRSPGYGLIGMRERAAAAGGRLTAGERQQGGFLVTAQLPIPPVKDDAQQTAQTPGEERKADGGAGDAP
ncbi:sensor histidine kinase [Streptomyces sp. NPDC017979]|uniref:sensor histidine kinase n=1 Tax=Streptomyces sp. NPDC017979 TaxID=3365024 RepID=UPI00379AC15C